jgi:hypothetical protein
MSSARSLDRSPVVLAVVTALLLVAGSAVAGTRQAAPPDRVAFLARADNPVDALAASAVAAQLGGVVLLSATDALSAEAADGLRAYDPDVVILAGGTAALAPAVEQAVRDLGYAVERVAGGSRLETAQRVAAILGQRQAAYLAVDGTAVAADTATAAQSAATAQTAEDADRLGGYEATDLTGLRVHTASNEVPIPGGILSWATLSTVQVEVPTDGWLALDASVLFVGGTTQQTVGCRFLLDGAAVGVGTLAETSDVLGVQTGSCLITGAIPVTAGTHTVGLQAAAETTGLRAGSRTLRALIAPFGSSG